MAGGAVFSELLDAWHTDGVRLLVPDLRGAGDSARARTEYALERYVEDVSAVLAAERVTRAVLVGHSMGGQIVQLMAASRPELVAGLVGVLPVPAAGLALPDEVRRLFRTAGGDAETLGRILDMASPGLQPAVRARLLSAALRIAPDCVAEAFDAWSAGGFADRLTAVRTRSLIVASDDAFLPVALLRSQVVQRIRGARLAVIEGAGHYLPNDRPGALAAVLEAFMAGLGDDQT
jgi:pimeloyl-ACP methyl ester carboxylesterase